MVKAEATGARGEVKAKADKANRSTPQSPKSAEFVLLQRFLGGVLLARVGENGKPIYIGKRSNIHPDSFGTLYFRINDDILSDNDGYVVVEVEVEGREAAADE